MIGISGARMRAYFSSVSIWSLERDIRAERLITSSSSQKERIMPQNIDSAYAVVMSGSPETFRAVLTAMV